IFIPESLQRIKKASPYSSGKSRGPMDLRPDCYNSRRTLRKDFMDIQTIVSDLRAERNRIDRAISALEGLTSSSSPRRGRPPRAKQAVRPGKKRRMSASARKRISDAMRKRWAKWHGK